MLLFILSLIGVILTFIALACVTALWVFKDAKSRSKDPVPWTILALVFPIGLVIYLAVGRATGDGAAPQKKNLAAPIAAIIILAILLITSIGLLTYSIVSGSMSGFGSATSGVFTMSSSRYSDGLWTYSARSANGRTSRSPNLTAEELSSFSVTSSNSEGEMRLQITQGDLELVVDLTGNYSGNPDLSRFSPGRIRLQLVFERASDVSTSVRWR